MPLHGARLCDQDADAQLGRNVRAQAVGTAGRRVCTRIGGVYTYRCGKVHFSYGVRTPAPPEPDRAHQQEAHEQGINLGGVLATSAEAGTHSHAEKHCRKGSVGGRGLPGPDAHPESRRHSSGSALCWLATCFSTEAQLQLRAARCTKWLRLSG